MKIFLNHAVEDKSLVMPYYEKLQALGYEPWIDKRLLPGDEWDEEIQRTFNSAPESSTFERFLVEPQGISLMYPQGGLFGYAAGAFGAELSWHEMEHLLKQDGPHLAAQKAITVDW